jgi:hypothetical protein
MSAILSKSRKQVAIETIKFLHHKKLMAQFKLVALKSKIERAKEYSESWTGRAVDPKELKTLKSTIGRLQVSMDHEVANNMDVVGHIVDIQMANDDDEGEEWKNTN